MRAFSLAFETAVISEKSAGILLQGRTHHLGVQEAAFHADTPGPSYRNELFVRYRYLSRGVH